MDKQGFLNYYIDNFSNANHLYDIIDNLIQYANNKFHSKDDVAYFVSEIIPEISFSEACMFCDDNELTTYGKSLKDAELFLNTVLEDDNSVEFGGTAYSGETLKHFLLNSDFYGMDSSINVETVLKNINEINDALKANGIKPLLREEQTIEYETAIDEIVGKAEELGWSVSVGYYPDRWHYGEEDVEITFSKRSPAGEDFGFDADGKNGTAIVDAVYDYSYEFDPEEHAAMRLVEREEQFRKNNTSDIPDLRTLLDDAEAIKKEIVELSDELFKLNLYKYSEEITAEEDGPEIDGR